MSRRTLMARVLAATTAIIGRTPLVSAAAGTSNGWNFSTAPLSWEPMEIATGDSILVSAEVRGAKVRAVLDSGSGATVLSRALAAKLGIGNGERRTISGLSAKAPVQLVRDLDVTLARQTRRLPVAVVADLTTVSAASGRSVDMLVGADMFTEKCIALDFRNKRVAVADSGAFKDKDGWNAVPLLRGSKRELLVKAAVAGLAPVPLMFDLGSSTALMLSAAYARAKGLLDAKPVSTAAHGGIDGIKIHDAFVTSEFTIEGLEITNVPTLGMRDWLPISTVGNVGLPLIAQFDVVIDVTAGFVWLRALDPDHRLAMLKDRSGLGFVVAPEGLTVVHVALNSPAEKGGWMVGDRIVSVNGHAVDADYTQGQLWRWRFLPAGTIARLATTTDRVRTLKLADYY